MIASRFPILAARYVPFTNKKSWQKLISYGCVMIKVDLDYRKILVIIFGVIAVEGKKHDVVFWLIFKKAPNEKRRIGFLANLHLMAYQGKENQIGEALNLVHEEFNQFRSVNVDKENERVIFAVIGGDFNFDNISPGEI
jgi:hypothetical protein